MNAHAYSKEGFFNEPQAGGNLPSPAGSFSARRAHYFTQAQKPPLTEVQQHSLIKLIREGDAGARREMIARNIHLVIDFARHYGSRGPAPLDLIREGTHGLVHALEEFELDGSSSFLDYATWRISHSIECAIINWNDPSCQRTPSAPAARYAAPSPMPTILSNKPLDNIRGGHGFPA